MIAGRLRQWLRVRNYDVAVRYHPLVRAVRRADPERRWSVLDVGSGVNGIAAFLPEFRVVGVDMAVAGTTAMPLVKGSTLCLPFGDRAWDVVSCVDVLEHLAPRDRGVALREILRVTRRLAIVAFPFGAGASEADRRMAASYQETGQPLPPWLAEHIQHPHPEIESAREWLALASRAGEITAWEGEFNERLDLQRVHRFLAQRWTLGYRIFSVLCSLALPWLPPPRGSGNSYRCVFFVTRGEPS